MYVFCATNFLLINIKASQVQILTKQLRKLFLVYSLCSV